MTPYLQPQRRAVPSGRAGSRGFTMVEVLVSLIIIAVGMLGLAKIQALAYASTGVAAQQSLAAVQAAGLASAMRANRGYWTAVTTPYTYDSVTSSSNTDANMTSTYVCTYLGANAPCSPSNLAAYDLQNWVTALGNTLPKPKATIYCPTPVSPAPLGCWIKVNWTEENVAINSQSVGNTLASPTYTLYVVP